MKIRSVEETRFESGHWILILLCARFELSRSTWREPQTRRRVAYSSIIISNRLCLRYKSVQRCCPLLEPQTRAPSQKTHDVRNMRRVWLFWDETNFPNLVFLHGFVLGEGFLKHYSRELEDMKQSVVATGTITSVSPQISPSHRTRVETSPKRWFPFMLPRRSHI